MTTSNLEYITVTPQTKNHDATIIWMHGLGADGNDFADIVDLLGLPKEHKIKFIFPHAPYRTITINNHMKMRAWYDLTALELNEREDTLGIKQSQQDISALIAHELSLNISSSRIMLAGFSQGGAIALYTGLRFSSQLAGIIALSTYQVLATTLEAERTTANANIPIFMAHGTLDDVVPFELAKNCYEQMHSLNYNIALNSYKMQHNVIAEEIIDIGNFIKQVLIS